MKMADLILANSEKIIAKLAKINSLQIYLLYGIVYWPLLTHSPLLPLCVCVCMRVVGVLISNRI